MVTARSSEVKRATDEENCTATPIGWGHQKPRFGESLASHLVCKARIRLGTSGTDSGGRGRRYIRGRKQSRRCWISTPARGRSRDRPRSATTVARMVAADHEREQGQHDHTSPMVQTFHSIFLSKAMKSCSQVLKVGVLSSRHLTNRLDFTEPGEKRLESFKDSASRLAPFSQGNVG